MFFSNAGQTCLLSLYNLQFSLNLRLVSNSFSASNTIVIEFFDVSCSNHTSWANDASFDIRQFSWIFKTRASLANSKQRSASIGGHCRWLPSLVCRTPAKILLLHVFYYERKLRKVQFDDVILVLPQVLLTRKCLFECHQIWF